MKTRRDSVSARVSVPESTYAQFCPLHSLFENTGDLIQSVSPEGQILFTNDAWRSTLGYSPSELSSLNIFQVIHPASHAHCREVIGRLLAGEEVGLVEIAFRKKDGSAIELEGKISAKREAGRLIATQGIFRDVSARKAAERNLERFFNLSQDGICISDFDGNLLRVNPALANALGYSVGELLALPRLAAVHPEDAPILEEVLRRLREGAPSASFEIRTRTRDGYWRLWSWKSATAPDQRLIYASGRDVTELRRATEALRQSEAEARKLALIAARTSNGVVLTDADGRVEWINEGFTRLTGYTLEEVRGQRPGRVLQGPNTDPATLDLMRRSLRQKQGFKVEVLNYSKTGHEFWIVVEVQPLFDTTGRLTHFMGLQTDITEQKSAAAKIHQLNADLERRVEERTLALQESERRHRTLLANLEGMAYRCANDPVWAMEFASEGCQKVLGIHPQELTSNRIRYGELIHPDDQDRVWSSIQAAIAKQKPFTLEYRVKHADGSWRWVWEQGHGVFDPQRGLQAIEGYITDITERVRAGEELRNSENRYRSMFESSHVVMLILDPEDGHILDANPTACRFYGWDRATLTAMRITQINTLDPESIAARMRAARKVERNFFAFHHQLADGSIREVEVASGPIELDGRSLLLSIVTDVTDRKQAEARLRESEARLRQIASSVGDAFWLRDAQTHLILFVNEAFEKLTGLTCQQFYDDPDVFLKTVHPADLERVRAGRAASFQGQVFDMEHRIIRADKQERWVRGRIFPVRDATGAVYRLVAVWNDITDRIETEQTRRKLEDQLRQAQKLEAIGQLAGGVAHDFNNLLAVIQMQVELLQTGPALPDEAQECATGIREAARRATALTRQLLLFSRRQVMQPQMLALNEVVANIIKMLQRILGEDIRLQVNYESQPLWIQADAGMMDQVLMNLAVNSRDAMPSGGKLAIETTAVEFTEASASAIPAARPGRFACLRVTDTGCGIAPENLQHIFEPFFTTKGVGKGTGLGLATVFGIVQQHQGWINVSSEVGHGTTFRVYFPKQTTPTQKSGTLAKVAMPRGGQETILVVEDEPALRTLITRVLKQFGYQVVEAETGVQARTVWTQRRDDIRLLVTDMVMPDGMSGKRLAESLRQETPQLKVIYMSGYSPETSGTDASVQEGVDFLSKPFDVFKLVELVRKRLDE